MLKESDCPGQCVSLKTAWGRDHPHLPAEFKDGGYAYAELGENASSYCVNCSGYVCTTCGKAPSDKLMGSCHPCAEQTAWDRWGYQEHSRWLRGTSRADLAEYKTIASWPRPWERLLRIMGEISDITGQHTDVIAKLINEELGTGDIREGNEGLIRQAVVLALSWHYELFRTDSDLPS